MAIRGIAYFDGKGQHHRTPDEATISDLAAILGRMGEGESLAFGIAKILLEKRREIEHVFADHDAMTLVNDVPARKPVLVSEGSSVVTHLKSA